MIRLFTANILIAALYLLILPQTGFAETVRLDENEVKAAYLYNFAKYVDWPAADSSTLNFCVLGRAPINASVMASLAEKPIKNRRVLIRELSQGDDISHCNLLFVNSTTRSQLAQIFKSASENSVLTVSDYKGFASAGGVIEFVTIGNRIRFKINNRSARQSNLKISSHLLNLATSVIE